MTPRAILAVMIGLGLAMIVFMVLSLALVAARGADFLSPQAITLIGMVVLGVVWLRAGRGFRQPSEVSFLECSATYWHMVDLLWIVLFPLVYLLK